MSAARLACGLGVLALLASACDPITGSGSGSVPDARRFLAVDDASRSAVLTLIAGYPATDNQFNYDGYLGGELHVTVPVGWTLDVQCENRGTVPNSCAVVAGRGATQPVRPDWTTPNPSTGIAPGQSASFEVVPDSPAQLRIASLVAGREVAGMWLRLDFVSSGRPSIEGTSATG